MKTRVDRIKVWFSSRRLKQKVRSLFILLMCIYLLLFLFIYVFAIQGSTQRYITETNHNILLSVSNSLERKLEGASTVSKWIMNSHEVRTYLKSNKDAQSKDAYGALASIYEFTNSEKHISSVYIFKNNGQYIDISNGMTAVDQFMIADPSWYQEIHNKAGAYVLRINGGGAFQTISKRPVISLIRVINDQQTQKPIGLLAINYTTEILRDTYLEMMDGERKISYFDKDGYYLCGDTMQEQLGIDQRLAEAESFFMKKTDENKTLYCYQVPEVPFIIVSHENTAFYNYISTQVIVLGGIFILVTVVSLVLIGLFISVYITGPIERLVQSMESVKSGWLKRVSLNLPNDEIGHLKNSYNNMLVEVNRLIEELIEKETAIQQAEIEVLQEQIKPHFLYNTLDTIAYLALERPGDEVYDAIETLGGFYRKFLSKGSRVIALSDEIEIVKNYFKLQRLRYDDVFIDEYLLQEELLNVQVPKLILQPLVENSLYHGVRLKGECGLIKISVFEKDQRIYIAIYDNGIGMSSDQIDHLMKEERKSFGLRKTIERIRAYYGVSDVYHINSRKGYYCEVVLKLPYNKEEVINDVSGDVN